nr:hypothetical protein [Liquorilactobacillus satsumensis]
MVPVRRALIDNGILFTPYMEKAVTQLLDYFELQEVDASVCLGGAAILLLGQLHTKKELNR